MPSREFLASFAVEIDKAGVTRLQQVLPDIVELIRVRRENERRAAEAAQGKGG